MSQGKIIIRPEHIRQAEADVRSLRKIANSVDCHEAAEALQDAIDRARLLYLAPTHRAPNISKQT